MSARAQVGTGSNILIVGFVISGSQPMTVLIRAVGPGLAALGFPGGLANPLLTVFDAGGNPIYANSGWKGSGVLSGAFRKVGRSRCRWTPPTPRCSSPCRRVPTRRKSPGSATPRALR